MYDQGTQNNPQYDSMLTIKAPLGGYNHLAKQSKYSNVSQSTRRQYTRAHKFKSK